MRLMKFNTGYEKNIETNANIPSFIVEHREQLLYINFYPFIIYMLIVMSMRSLTDNKQFKFTE